MNRANWPIGRALPPCLLGLALLGAGCQQRNEFKPPPPPSVTVAHPVERPIAEYLEFTGTTRATQQIDLRAKVTGYLEHLKFKDGATVEKGDPLFILEQAPFLAKLEAAKAEMKRAEASLKLADAEIARAAALQLRNAMARQELDLKVADKEIALANLAATKAAVRTAELELSYTEIRAPISGRIGRRLVDVGNLVRQEDTLLATIEAYTPIYVYFTMSEADLLRFDSLRTLGTDPTAAGPSLEMGLGKAETFPYRGNLDFSELGVDPATGTVTRRAVFPNTDKGLVPGLFSRLRLSVAEPKPSVLVPDRALGADQRGEYVLVVDQENTVIYRQVKTGPLAADGLRVIREGLKGDEWVVVNGVQRARPGGKVDPKPTEDLVSFKPDANLKFSDLSSAKPGATAAR